MLIEKQTKYSKLNFEQKIECRFEGKMKPSNSCRIQITKATLEIQMVNREQQPNKVFVMSIQDFRILSNLSDQLENKVLSNLSSIPWVDEYFKTKVIQQKDNQVGKTPQSLFDKL